MLKNSNIATQHCCHSRYKSIIENRIPKEDQSRLSDDFNNWRKTLYCIEFWKEQKRVHASSAVDSNCSVINKFSVKNSEGILAFAENFSKPVRRCLFFIAKNQHSDIKTSFFSEELLDKLLDNQKQVLLDKIPDTCPGFTKEDYMAVLEVLTSIDQNVITPKQAKLKLLSLAASMDSFKGNVIERIVDL